MTFRKLLSPALVPSLVAFALPVTLGLAGCSGDDMADDGDLIDVEAAGKGDAFDTRTNPIELIKLVNSSPTLRADELAPAADVGKDISVATDARPFSSTYWPMVNDGILARWQGAGVPSPAEKYGALFLTPDQQKSMTDWITNNHGKKVPGVQSWFGICQGWTGSAIMEKAPQKAITVRKYVRDGKTYIQRCTGSTTGCQTFAPGDITGLLAESYANSDSRFVGDRCDTATVNFKYDGSGRIVQPNCRSNAGTLFLTATNFIKKAGRAFAINAVNNDEVWNQPAYAYKLLKYETVTEAQAAAFIDPTKTSYEWNTAARGFRHVRMALTWTVEAQPTKTSPPPVLSNTGTYEFILELDAGGAVIGGEWIGTSKSDHPPFFWAPVSPGTEVPNLTYSYVRALLDASRM